MAGVEISDVVHARILRFFPELVAQLGGELRVLLRKAGIDADYFSDGSSGARYRQIVTLIELAAEELACPDFGMRLAKLQSGGTMFGPLGTVMKNSKTFGDALEYVSEHMYAHSLAARVWLKRLPREKAVFSGHDILIDGVPNKTQAVEQIMLLGHIGAMEMTGGCARVRQVHFRHQPLSPLRTYRRYFGCEVRFGQNADGVIFSDQDLACRIVAPDARTFERVTAFIDQRFTQQRPPLHLQARGVIMQFLWSGDCTNEQVASELSMHSRTLHRRLKSEGTTFQKIKDEVRRDILLYYVQETNLDFARISERLGFAEQSVMTRTCRRWLSASPSKIRAQGRHAHARSLAPAA
jgi:AraC-like DNA-binding protein